MKVGADAAAQIKQEASKSPLAANLAAAIHEHCVFKEQVKEEEVVEIEKDEEKEEENEKVEEEVGFRREIGVGRGGLR